MACSARCNLAGVNAPHLLRLTRSFEYAKIGLSGQLHDRIVIMSKVSKIEFRLTPEEKEIIQQAADYLEISVSDYVRGTVLDKAKAHIAMRDGNMTREEMIDFLESRARYEVYSAST